MRRFFSGSYHGKERRLRPRAGRYTRYALYIAIASFLWSAFKWLEPMALPVVKNFEIKQVQNVSKNEISISGSFEKVRSCRYLDVIAYSGDQFVRVKLPGGTKISRMTRRQTYGPWILSPKTSRIELYSRHQCATGEVITQLFSGAIAL